MKYESIYGAILGCMVGDALGLLYEGISPKRQARLFKNIEKSKVLLGTRLISDDTEHMIFTAYSLCRAEGDVEKFGEILSKSMKKWFLTLPYGIGMATLKSSIKLLLGWDYKKSGVKSAGNGAAMRSAIIGICYGHDIEKMKKMVKYSTGMSHTDEKAEIGALVIAYSAYLSNEKVLIDFDEYVSKICWLLEGYNNQEFLDSLQKIILCIKNNQTTLEFAKSIGLENGISGYIYHTVPMVIHCWLSNQGDFRSGILEIIKCGGDTDTTAAILGAIMGTGNRIESIPKEWTEGILLWPFSIDYIKKLSRELCNVLEGKAGDIREENIFLIAMRNLLLYPVIILQALRRLLPPY